MEAALQLERDVNESILNMHNVAVDAHDVRTFSPSVSLSLVSVRTFSPSVSLSLVSSHLLISPVTPGAISRLLGAELPKSASRDN